MGRLRTKNRWQETTTRGRVVKSVLCEELFVKYLEKSKDKSCLEIGCIPGTFMVYLSKNFGYFPEGIDYIEKTKEITEETFKINGIKEYEIHQADFLTWDAPKKYDLVCSFGFIEHFTGPDEKKVIDKHIELVKPGGKLVIDVPNFNYGQYLIHLLLDKRGLKEHNIRTMNLSYYKKIARKFNLKILYLGYYGGPFRFWVEHEDLNFIQRKVYYALRVIEAEIRRMRIKGFNNRFFSPRIVFIAEKKEATPQTKA